MTRTTAIAANGPRDPFARCLNEEPTLYGSYTPAGRDSGHMGGGGPGTCVAFLRAMRRRLPLRGLLLVSAAGSLLALGGVGCSFDGSAAGGSTSGGRDASNVAPIDAAGGDDGADDLGGDQSGGDQGGDDQGGDQGGDDAGLPDAAVVGGCDESCPGQCESDGTCHVRCGDDRGGGGGTPACPERVVCPPGIPCRVDCGGADSCGGGVDCSQATSCGIECTGDGSCGGALECGGGSCDIRCTQDETCQGGIDCQDSCFCSVQCDGEGACQPEATCPAGCDGSDGECLTNGSSCRSSC